MSDPTDLKCPGHPGETSVEARLRHLLSERADGLPAHEAPYAAIARQGRAARRRSWVALGAGAAVLAAAVPGAAFAANNVWFPDESASTIPQLSEPREDEAPDPDGTAAEPEQDGPVGPSEPDRQLLDGITLEEARTSLEQCVEEYGPEVALGQGAGTAPAEAEGMEVKPEDLRILLAWVSQGDENRGEEPITQVLAVSDDPRADPHLQFVCADRASGAQGMQSSVGAATLDNGLPVYPDINAGPYYGPMMGEWDLPFRWADFGLVAPEVDRVTVSHAGVTEEAVIEAGYFVVAGISEQQPAGSPVVMGYGAGGEVLYDSREDPMYE